MRSSVVVTYTISSEAYAEHVRLISDVFAQLGRERPETVDYQVMCLADGVSFVHVSSHESDDGASPLTGLTAFKEFGRDIGSRVATPPTPSAATVIGEYRGLTE